MSVTLVTSPTVVRVGPGYLLQCVTTSGPTALDDLLIVDLVDSASGLEVCFGSVFWGGFTNQPVLLGRVVNSVHGLPGHQGQLQAGGSVDLQMRHTNVSGALVTSGTITGLQWDPVNGIGALMTALTAGGSGGHDAMLDDILAAVRRTYP